MTRPDLARSFVALHQAGFVMPNAWDAGSAKLLAAEGFPAIGVTSAGVAFSLGKPDYQIGDVAHDRHDVADLGELWARALELDWIATVCDDRESLAEQLASERLSQSARSPGDDRDVSRLKPFHNENESTT